jgi:hypothetical protein
MVIAITGPVHGVRLRLSATAHLLGIEHELAPRWAA